MLDEVQRDPAATAPAVVVAGGATLLLGVGGWLWWSVAGLGDRASVFMKSALLGSLFSLAMWLVWLLIVYAVVLRMTGRPPAVERLLRAAGFATAPLALGLLMLVPGVAFAVGLTALALWVLAMQRAVEASTGAPARVAAVANAAGFAAWAGTMSLLATGTDPLAPGPFLAESIWDAVARLALTSLEALAAGR